MITEDTTLQEDFRTYSLLYTKCYNRKLISEKNYERTLLDTTNKIKEKYNLFDLTSFHEVFEALYKLNRNKNKGR